MDFDCDTAGRAARSVAWVLLFFWEFSGAFRQQIFLRVKFFVDFGFVTSLGDFGGNFSWGSFFGMVDSVVTKTISYLFSCLEKRISQVSLFLVEVDIHS